MLISASLSRSYAPHRHLIGLNHAKKLILGSVALATLAVPAVVGLLPASAIDAQDVIDWQSKAGTKLAFDVASVKLSTGEFVPPSFPLTAGEAFRLTGGRFTADFPLSTYIQFAYKLWPNEEQNRELSRLPKWVADDRYRIEARAAIENPTKDQIRLMMQSLLVERFQVAAHFEAREVPVLELRLAKAGRPGPKLVSHSDGPPCDKPGVSPSKGFPGFPPGCGSFAMIKIAGNMLAGSRDITMGTVANQLFALELGRPVVDKTGLSGTYDFTIQWTPERLPSAESASPTPSDLTLSTNPIEALRDQLGLKLEPARASLPILVIDKVSRPSEN